MRLQIFVDVTSIVFFIIILAIAIAVYYRIPSKKERLLGIGSFVQTLTLGFGLVYAVRMLAVVDSMSEIGAILAVCLLTPFYGILANLVLKMYVLFGRSEIQAE